MQQLVEPWPDYALLDTGDGEKLEKFGAYVLRRPEPQAIWPKAMPQSVWEKMPDATFLRGKGNEEAGNWTVKPGMQDPWYCRYEKGPLNLRYKLSLSAFKHVGVFPEQSANWDFMATELTRIQKECGEVPKVLNLFAYTGIASLAARSLRTQVTHVDAVRQVLSWGKDNMEASKLDGIRWLADDALKFVRREERRGNRYHCIILDPPAYGRGPEGEKWILEDSISELMRVCSQILAQKSSCLILNLYSMGYSACIAENLCRVFFPQAGIQSGELVLADTHGRKLPLGVFCRVSL